MTKPVPIPSNPPFLHEDILHIYDQFLRNILMQTHVTDPDHVNFPHQSSVVDEFFSVLGTFEETIFSFRNRFPRNDPTNHIQKDLDLLLIVFRSVLDQFSLVENPDAS